MSDTHTHTHTNGRTKVEFISEAEFRMGEIKVPCVIYSRKGKVFVRRASEFHSNFKPIKSNDQQHRKGQTVAG